jgi:Protein of unknown function (DUF2934)
MDVIKTNIGRGIMSRIDKKKPNQKDIELRAYELYLQRGGEDGNELSDWLAAEKELTESLQIDTSEATAPHVMPSKKLAAVS